MTPQEEIDKLRAERDEAQKNCQNAIKCSEDSQRIAQEAQQIAKDALAQLSHLQQQAGADTEKGGVLQ